MSTSPKFALGGKLDLGELSSLPPGILLPVPLFACFCALYRFVAPRFETEKQRAYVLSSLSSATMTLASLPFVYGYLTGGIGRMWYLGNNGWTKHLADLIVAFFGTYLFSDLTIGFVAYRKQVGLLTGWIHHLVYIGVMVHCATSLQSCVFLTASIMELPTFDLAISSLFPSVRNDERFLSLMLATRIIFNTVLLIDTLRPSSRQIMEGSWIPAVILGLALTLHASWMRGGVVGYLKRRSKARTAAKAAKEAAAAAAAEKEAKRPPHLELGGSTPEDSPLVTPYAAPADAFIIPGVGPLPAIPTLSSLTEALPQAKANLSALHSEFSAAVHARLEEQRERLALHGFLRRRAVYAEDDELSD